MNTNLIRFDNLPEEEICKLIRHDPSIICDRIPRTELYCLTAVQQGGQWLKYVPKTVQTPEICLTAVKNCGNALEFVSPKLISHDICLEAIKNDARAIRFVPKQLINKTLLLEALGKDGMLLGKIYSPLLDDEEFVVTAVAQNGLALKYVERKFLKKPLCLMAVRQNGLALEYVPKRTRSEALCKEALFQNPLAFQFVPDKLKTAEICEEIVLRNPLSLQFVPIEMMTEKLCELALVQNALTLQFVPTEMRTERLCALALDQSTIALQFVPTEIWTERLCEVAVTQNAMSLQYIPDELKSKDLCDLALHKDYLSFEFIPSVHLSLCDYVYVLQNLQAELMNEEIAVQANDNLQLVKRCIADWPDEIKVDSTIVSLNRSIGLQKILSKKYDAEEKVFIVEEKYLYSNETKTYTFSAFHDFYSYLGGDLSDSNLYAYDFDGVDLRSYAIVNAGISSDVLIQHGLYDPTFYDSVITNNSHLYSIQTSQSNELVPAESVLHQADFFATSPKTKRKLYYISDLHLDHKVKKAFPSHASKEEITKFIDNLVQKMISSADERDYGDYLLIAGDVAFSFELAEIFYSLLAKKWWRVICVLGNHEYWECNRTLSDTSHDTVAQCVLRYKELFNQLGFTFLHNDMLILDSDDRRNIIRESVLTTASESQLLTLRSNLINNSRLVILGGTGFSGYNLEFNATNGIYRRAIETPEDDLAETKRFEELHHKLSKSLGDIPVVVLTHMPKEDWTNEDYNSQWIYVNGHNHRNQFFVDDQRTVYSDNQIGYQNYGSIGLKYFLTDKTMDIFIDYPDGIHKITREQYLAFNRGKLIYIRFNRADGKIFMLKNAGMYCFLFENEKGIYLLNGGMPNKLVHQEMDYYYQRMPLFSSIVNHTFERYYALLNQLSLYVKKIGGYGRVHGSIVDIDFYNHIIVNPETLQVTPYYAEDIVRKVFYPNLQTLLLEKRPDIHTKLLALQERQPEDVGTLKRITNNNGIRKAKVVKDTSMYKQSALAKKAQYLLENNIIRVWDDGLLQEAEQLARNIALIDATK